MQEILKKKRKRSGSYAPLYDTLINHINEFSDVYDCNIYTNSVTEDFLEDFIIYLQNRNLRKNTIKGYIEKIQTLVRKAGQYGYAVDNTYDQINLREEDSYAVYLSMNEITRIYYYQFKKQDKRKAREKIRDLFVLGCLTGLRYSDYSTLTNDNFANRYIVKRTKKTNVTVKIPMHDYVKEIIDKYDGRIPGKYNIQYFNAYLKVICKEIGLTDKITYSFTCGGKLKTVTKEKWQLISSHTARRSAATNMYLTGRMKPLEIMRIIGHKSESCFFRYIRVTEDDTARMLSGDIFYRK